VNGTLDEVVLPWVFLSVMVTASIGAVLPTTPKSWSSFERASEWCGCRVLIPDAGVCLDGPGHVYPLDCAVHPDIEAVLDFG
jgi:hypothetical protein